MKDIMNERLILIATAQKCMTDVAEMMEQWDDSQLNTEKYAFDSMNVSDKVLNLSKEGNSLIEHLHECCKDVHTGLSNEKCKKMVVIQEELKRLFLNIMELSYEANDIAHKIEGEVSSQKEIEEGIKCQLSQLGENLDAAVACDEFIMAEL